jgi:drug/metabolite transporter (DMT)-like permease
VESSESNGPWLLGALLLVLGTLGLVLALFGQFFDVYFTIGGDPPQPTAAQGTRWAWTASACVGAGVAAVFAALRSGSRGMRWSSGIVLVIALVASVVFIVPRDRWDPPPKTNEPPSGYVPCFSGSNTCVGGMPDMSRPSTQVST